MLQYLQQMVDLAEVKVVILLEVEELVLLDKVITVDLEDLEHHHQEVEVEQEQQDQILQVILLEMVELEFNLQ